MEHGNFEQRTSRKKGSVTLTVLVSSGPYFLGHHIQSQ